jgi:hypothetical protein
MLSGLAATASADDAAKRSPEDTVRAYLKAAQKGDFTTAYDYVADTMRAGKNREEWVKEQQWVMQASEAKIFDFQVFPGKIEGDKARVPNILSSQDKYLNQLGVEEHELYTLVRQDGAWKIAQQTIVEPSEISRWFPAAAVGGEKQPAP